MKDPIVEEVRKARDAYAAKFNYDLDAIFRDLKEKEAKSGQVYITFPPRPVVVGNSFPVTEPDVSTPDTSHLAK